MASVRLWVILVLLFLVVQPHSVNAAEPMNGPETYALSEELTTLPILEKMILTNFAGGPRTDIGEINYMKAVYADFFKAMPRIQLISLMRKQLIPILQAYQAVASPEDIQLAKTAIGILQKAFPLRSQDAVPTNFRLVFARTTDGIFQVDGIKSNRLAVNTGDSIIFHVNGLIEKETFTLEDVTQLLLHEVMHLDTHTELAIKDRWSTKVSDWVKTNSTTLSLGKDVQLLTLNLPKPESTSEYLEKANDEKQSWKTLTPTEQLKLEIQNQFLALHQSTGGTRVYDEIYQGFKTFDNRTDQQSANWDDYHNKVLNWPHVKIGSVRLNATGKLLIEYGQVSNFFESRYAVNQNTKYPKFGESSAITTPDVPEANFRIEFDPKDLSIETSRTYSSVLKNGDFEIYRATDKTDKRYLRIHLKLNDIANTIKSENGLRLIAKDLQTMNQISLPVSQIRFLRANEAVLRVEAPLSQIELNQILIPQVNAGGFYSELSIKPSKRIMLQGLIPFTESKLKVKKMVFKEAKKEKESAKLQIDINSEKKVVGITLDLQHLVELKSTNWDRVTMGHPFTTPLNGDEIMTYAGVGRKYLITGKDLTLKTNGKLQSVQFAVPAFVIAQEMDGPEYEKTITWAYHVKFTAKARTIVDTLDRQVTNAWIHFTDGTFEKIPTAQLPADFSLANKASAERLWQERRARFDLDENETASKEKPPRTKSSKKIRCESLFQ